MRSAYIQSFSLLVHFTNKIFFSIDRPTDEPADQHLGLEKLLCQASIAVCLAYTQSFSTLSDVKNSTDRLTDRQNDRHLEYYIRRESPPKKKHTKLWTYVQTVGRKGNFQPNFFRKKVRTKNLEVCWSDMVVHTHISGIGSRGLEKKSLQKLLHIVFFFF